MFNSNFGNSSLSIQNKNAIIEPTPEQRNELFKLLVDDPMYYSVELPLILPDTNEDLAEFGAKARRIFKNSNFEKDTDDYSKKELMVQLANNIIGTIREKRLKPKITDAIVGTDGVDGYALLPVGTMIGDYDISTHTLYRTNSQGQRVNSRGNVMRADQVARQNQLIARRMNNERRNRRPSVRLNIVPDLDMNLPRENVAELSNSYYDTM